MKLNESKKSASGSLLEQQVRIATKARKAPALPGHSINKLLQTHRTGNVRFYKDSNKGIKGAYKALQGYTSLYKGIGGKKRKQNSQGGASDENGESSAESRFRALCDGTAANSRVCAQHSCPAAYNWYNGTNAPESVN